MRRMAAPTIERELAYYRVAGPFTSPGRPLR